MVHLICFGTINGILFAVTTFGMTIMVSMLSVENLDSARVQGGSRTLITAKMLSKLGHVRLERTLHLALGNKTSTEWTPTADLVREIMLLLLHVLEILRALKKIAAQIFLLLPFLKQQRRRAHVMEIYRLAIGVVIKLFLSLQRQITLNAE